MFLTKTLFEIVEKQRVKLLQNVELGFDSAAIRLEPGEGFQCVFKINALACLGGAESDAKLRATVFRNVKELDQFSELFFSWYS